MIITRSPLRISLGGGGTDLPSYYERFGGFLITAAIDKYVARGGTALYDALGQISDAAATHELRETARAALVATTTISRSAFDSASEYSTCIAGYSAPPIASGTWPRASSSHRVCWNGWSTANTVSM